MVLKYLTIQNKIQGADKTKQYLKCNKVQTSNKFQLNMVSMLKRANFKISFFSGTYLKQM